VVPPTSSEQVVPDLLQGEVVVVEPQPALLVPPAAPPVPGEPPVPTVPPELDPPVPTVPPELDPPVPTVPPELVALPPPPVVPPLPPPLPADDPHAPRPRLVRPSKKRPLKRIRAVTVMGSSSLGVKYPRRTLIRVIVQAFVPTSWAFRRRRAPDNRRVVESTNRREAQR
jgi:hypothetical protein